MRVCQPLPPCPSAGHVHAAFRTDLAERRDLPGVQRGDSRLEVAVLPVAPVTGLTRGLSGFGVDVI